MQPNGRALTIKSSFYGGSANCTVQQPREHPEHPKHPDQPGGVASGDGDPRSTALSKNRGKDANGAAGECALQVPCRKASDGGASDRGASSGTAEEERGQGGEVDQIRCVEAKVKFLSRNHAECLLLSRM